MTLFENALDSSVNLCIQGEEYCRAYVKELAKAHIEYVVSVLKNRINGGDFSYTQGNNVILIDGAVDLKGSGFFPRMTYEQDLVAVRLHNSNYSSSKYGISFQKDGGISDSFIIVNILEKPFSLFNSPGQCYKMANYGATTIEMFSLVQELIPSFLDSKEILTIEPTLFFDGKEVLPNTRISARPYQSISRGMKYHYECEK